MPKESPKSPTGLFESRKTIREEDKLRDCHLSEIKKFRCQEREIEPIDEIVRLLP